MAAFLKVLDLPICEDEGRTMKTNRLIVVALTALLALACVPGKANASPASAVMTTINHAIAAFNKGDMKTWTAACASPASVIDDFPPHSWQGPTACADWASSYAAFSKKNGISNGIVTLGTPWHVAVTGAHAYVVCPASYTYQQNGKPMKESGSIFTLVLTKAATGWLVTSWAWAQH
jgi:SnoaL-like domain